MARLWLLDFDGTLVDSEKAIKECYLRVGQELVPEKCSFIENMVIGPTLEQSSRIILSNENIHLLDKFMSRFQQLYDKKLLLDTPQYPHVNETLKILRYKGDHLSIITNKRTYPTHKLIDYYGWHNLFNWVACMDEYPNAKDKSDLIKIKNIDQDKYDEIYFIGDTVSDGIAANKSNISFVRANYGYGYDQDWSNISIHKNIDNLKMILKF